MGELPQGTRWLAALIGLVFVVGVASGVVRAADDEDDDSDAATEQTTTTKSDEDDDDDKDDETTSTTRATTSTTRATTTTAASTTTTTTAGGGGGATTTTRPRGSTTTTAAATTTTAAPANQADLEVAFGQRSSNATGVTYTVALHNLGPGDAGTAGFTVTAPAGVRLCRAEASDGNGNCPSGAGNSVSVSGLSVPEAGRFVGIRADSSGACFGDVHVSGSAQAPDPNTGNNSDTATGKPVCT
jgi:hypothetical protein